MKKTAVLIVGLLVMLAFAAVPATAGKTKKIKTNVTVDYKQGNSSDPYDEFAKAKFKGAVNASKKFCEKKRKVKIQVKNGATVGSEFTDGKGRYKIDAAGFGPDKYKAKAVKKVKRNKKGKKKIVCKSGTANIKVK